MDVAHMRRYVTECAEIAGRHSAAVDSAARFPVEAVDALKMRGLLSCSVPNDLGGYGASVAELAEACSILGRSCAATAMIFAMHHTQLLCLLRHGGGAPRIKTFLAECVEGQLLIASATSERGVRGSIRSSVAAFKSSDGNVELDKDCTTISYGEYADAVLVTARSSITAPDASQQIALFVKPNYTLSQSGEWDTLGMRGTCSGGFTFSGFTSQDAVLEEEFRLISSRTMTPSAHILWAGVWLGIASSAVSTALALHRTNASAGPHGHRLSESRLVSANSNLDLLSRLVSSAALDFESQTSSQPRPSYMVSVNNIKLAASKLSVDICMDALAYCGLAGYSNISQHSVAKNVRDVLSAPLMISNDRVSEINSTLILLS